MSRYLRQMTLPEMGREGQARLGAAKVLVIGAGGLGAGVLPLLAGAGIGQITIVDGDVVDRSNLHRQTMFTEDNIGAFKSEIAATRCRALNSEIGVHTVTERLTPANAPSLMAGVDLVVDCADSYAVSYCLSDLCLASNTPLITASVLGFSGYAGGFCAGAPSLRAVFPDAPDNGASCATAGVMGPIVTMIGAIQAQMVLTYLAGIAPSPLGQMVQIDGKSWRNTAFRFDGAPEPDQAFAFVAASQLSSDDVIVELRGADEAPQLLHPEATRLSVDEVLARSSALTGRLALCCATGLRSWRAAEQISQNWPGEIVLVSASSS